MQTNRTAHGEFGRDISKLDGWDGLKNSQADNSSTTNALIHNHPSMHQFPSEEGKPGAPGRRTHACSKKTTLLSGITYGLTVHLIIERSQLFDLLSCTRTNIRSSNSNDMKRERTWFLGSILSLTGDGVSVIATSRHQSPPFLWLLLQDDDADDAWWDWILSWSQL